MLEEARQAADSVSSEVFADRILADLALAYAERLEFGHAMSLVESINSRSQRDATYEVIARTLTGKHDLQCAQLSVQAISSASLRRRAEDDVARSFAKQVRPKEALKRARVLSSSRQRMKFLLEVSRSS